MTVLTNPVRLEIQKRLTAALEEISTADGYHHDLAGHVFRGRAVFGKETAIPAVSILETPIPLDQIPSPTDAPILNGAWELMIQGWVKDDKENPTDPAHILLADVKKRLILEREKADWGRGDHESGILGLGRVVTAIRLAPGVVRPPDEISAKAYFWLVIELDIAEDMSDPYKA